MHTFLHISISFRKNHVQHSILQQYPACVFPDFMQVWHGRRADQRIVLWYCLELRSGAKLRFFPVLFWTTLFCYVCYILLFSLCCVGLPHSAQMLLLGQRTFFPLTLADALSFGDMDRTWWRRLQCPSPLLSFCAQRRTLQRTQEKTPLGMEWNKDLNVIQIKHIKHLLLQKCSNSTSNRL